VLRRLDEITACPRQNCVTRGVCRSSESFRICIFTMLQGRTTDSVLAPAPLVYDIRKGAGAIAIDMPVLFRLASRHFRSSRLVLNWSGKIQLLEMPIALNPRGTRAIPSRLRHAFSA
jgi:hypothetical protein